MQKMIFYMVILLALGFTACKKAERIPVRQPGDYNPEADLSRKPLTITPNALKIADNESFYGGFVDAAAWSGCAIRTPNTRRIGAGEYIKLLTNAEKDKIGDSISLRIELYGAYDEWDRNGSCTYFKVPRNSVAMEAIKLGNYIQSPLLVYTTPYFTWFTNPNRIRYTRNISAYAQDLRDKNSDVYIVYSVGANPVKYNPPGDPCNAAGFKADIFMDTYDKGPIANAETKQYVPLLSKGLRQGEEIKTVDFELKEDLENAYIWYTSSGHSAEEEGYSRQHVLSMDGNEVASFDSKVTCDPATYYDSINPTGGRGPFSTWRYPVRNWCQGGEVVPRLFTVGSLAAGRHSFTLNTQQLNAYAGYVIENGIARFGAISVRQPRSITGYLSTNAVLIGDRKKK